MKNLFIRYVLLFCCVVMVTPFSGAYGSTTFDRVSAVEGDTSKLSKVFRATEYVITSLICFSRDVIAMAM